MPLEAHANPRGTPGFTIAITTASGDVYRQVVPAVSLVDASGALIAGATETTLAAISTKLPASLGAKTSAASLSIVPATDANYVSLGATTLTAAQADVTTTAVFILASSATRRKVRCRNLGTTGVFLGNSAAVTATSGYALPGIVGAEVELEYSGDLYAITAAGTQRISIAALG